MNRTIKFRAWDRVQKQMLYPQSGYQIETPGEDYFDADVYWMQYVGLNDKNLKDVYEGDIVKVLIGHPSVISSPFKVIFSLGAFQLASIENLSFPPIAFVTVLVQAAENIEGFDETHFNTCFEVVGNIYENPELIQQEVQP